MTNVLSIKQVVSRVNFDEITNLETAYDILYTRSQLEIYNLEVEIEYLEKSIRNTTSIRNRLAFEAQLTAKHREMLCLITNAQHRLSTHTRSREKLLKNIKLIG